MHQQANWTLLPYDPSPCFQDVEVASWKWFASSLKLIATVLAATAGNFLDLQIRVAMNHNMNHEYTKEYQTERIRKKGCRWPSSFLSNLGQQNKFTTNLSCHTTCQVHRNVEDCHKLTNQSSTWKHKRVSSKDMRTPSSKDMKTIKYKKSEDQIYSMMSMEDPICASKMGVRPNSGHQIERTLPKRQRLNGSDGWCFCLCPC